MGGSAGGAGAWRRLQCGINNKQEVTLAATWPILLAVAAFGALALVVADVVGYFSGMDSITGRLAQKFPELNKFLQASKEEVLTLWNAFVMLFTDPLQFLDNLKGEIKGLLDSLLWDGAGDTVFSFLTSAGKEITDLWNGLEKLIDKVVGIALKGFGKISEAWQKVKRWFGMGKDEVAKAESEAQPVTPAPPAHDMTYGGQTQLQAAASNPLTSMTSNAISNSSRQVSQRTDVRIDNIEIQTQATDAKGIAREIPGNLKDATWHFDDGLKA
ncbi:hypothetical protein ACFFJN_07935 [Erwinia mallotivora]|uniref:hypothetical protein n=1 Tax=Erwinia mallotivora TaxID=69222 RepID=UPI0035E5E302